MDNAAITQLPPAGRPRMAWRCRRGMKELDLLLSGWLDTQFERASDAQRRQFEALLELPDPQLAGYLLGGQRPEGADLAALVECITGASRIMSTPLHDGNLPPGAALQVSLVPPGTADRS
ncbi:MAG TPA: succinate dehydrogenase assembly factor 2 [Steroidobacteraceae bacterium]|jgi:antitoxin CptB|nr:succinate dehydrogenase assembly factor 2 [Steroidobacteraceae bacterium]